MYLNVKRLDADTKLPRIAHEDDVGYDLYSTKDVTVSARSRSSIGTGIAIEMPSLPIPYKVYGRVCSKSGLSAKKGLEVGAGVIDPSYRGEICVILHNHTDEPYFVEKGDPVAQLVLELCICPQIKEVETELSKTERGSDGFGSTYTIN